MQTVVVLGPQRFRPTVAAALDSLGVRGAVALVTAGWQEREGEDEELREHIGRSAVNLEIYRRANDALERDPELAAALRGRQDRLQRMQELYRIRLDHTLAAAREMMRRRGTPELILAERRSAIRALRALDLGHLRRVRKEHAEVRDAWRPHERDAVAGHRRELAEKIGDAEALLVAGGHVAVLLNRLRLFDLAELAAGKPIVAWSAGAMALSERVVLFHDSPPQGAGNAEVFDNGMGLFRKLLPLPHARRRLHLEDPLRVALLARRFAPAACVALDDEARVDCSDGRLTIHAGTRRLDGRGRVVAA